jgi:phosphoglycolate phosphatase
MITDVLFDLDGTLVHSAPGILATFTRVLADAGVTPVDAVDERVIGPPLVPTLERLSGLPPGPELDRIAAAFRALYDTKGALEADPYPGMDDVLRAIRGAGRRTFIVTNKRRLPAQAIAERLGISPYLSGLYTLDTLEPAAARKQEVVAHILRTHRIAPTSAVLVGDSVEDAAAAAAHGMRFVAAEYGYGTPSAFTGAGPAAVLERLSDLPGVLAALD